MIIMSEFVNKLVKLGYSKNNSHEIVAKYISLGLIDELCLKIESELKGDMNNGR